MGRFRIRAVGYARVSSDSQVDNTSIEIQIEKITDYGRLYDYELVKVFVDNGKSGAKTDCRSDYNAMIDYISAPDNEIRALITLKADRIHRKLKNLLVMIEDFLMPADIAFISILENFDTSTSQGMLFLQMLGSFAEFERAMINERTRSGRVKTAKNKGYAGGEPPFGYKAVNGRIEVDETRAGVIREIFKLYVTGMKPLKIARYLNERCIKTKTEKGLWSRQAIDYILKNPFYTGTYTYNGIKEANGISNKGQIPSIVSARLFNSAQAMRRTPSRTMINETVAGGR